MLLYLNLIAIINCLNNLLFDHFDLFFAIIIILLARLTIKKIYHHRLKPQDDLIFGIYVPHVVYGIMLKTNNKE